MDKGKLTHLELNSIDRLGRDTLSVLQTWKDFTEKGIRVVCSNPNFQKINEVGQTDIFSELMLSILSVMADFEKRLSKERQREGIAKAKLESKYRGRVVGTAEPIEKFLSKPKAKMIIKDFDNGNSTQEIANRCRCSCSTIQKVRQNRRLTTNLVTER